MARMPQTISFSGHAQYQLKERHIAQHEVIEIVRNPDKIIQQSSSRFCVFKITAKQEKTYLLVVIYDHANSSIEIVTAFYTSKIKKYL